MLKKMVKVKVSNLAIRAYRCYTNNNYKEFYNDILYISCIRTWKSTFLFKGVMTMGIGIDMGNKQNYSYLFQSLRPAAAEWGI